MTGTIRCALTYVRELQTTDARPWLIVGKGPSADRFHAGLQQSHHVFALNHAMRGAPARIGHAVDAEVLDQIAAADFGAVEALCMPWIPHVRHKRRLSGATVFAPGSCTLADLCLRSSVLRRYRDSGRLLCYNLISAGPDRRRAEFQTVEGHTFSAAIAMRLLAQSGMSTIHTLGVDGGSSYGGSFKDLEAVTKLQTIQTDFDTQFDEMATTIRRHALTTGPLGVEVPVRVFVGSMPEQDLAFQVLRYSIRRHASVSVDVQRLDRAVERRRVPIPEPADHRNRGRTPFSFQRFAIPELCDRRGRAVYVDSDMLVVKDIRSLWLHDMKGHPLVSVAQPETSGRKPQFSVLLLDCEQLDWSAQAIVAGLDAGSYSYEGLMHGMAGTRWAASLPATWNSLEHYEPGTTHLIHFTDMDGQPWLDAMHPFGEVWVRYLMEAIGEGEILLSTVEAEVAAGNVRPSLLSQLLRGHADARRLPFAELRRDLQCFRAPHRLDDRLPARARHELRRSRVLCRHVFQTYLLGGARRLVRSLRYSIGRGPRGAST